jgi:hypothetical protein
MLPVQYEVSCPRARPTYPEFPKRRAPASRDFRTLQAAIGTAIEEPQRWSAPPPAIRRQHAKRPSQVPRANCRFLWCSRPNPPRLYATSSLHYLEVVQQNGPDELSDVRFGSKSCLASRARGRSDSGPATDIATAGSRRQGRPRFSSRISGRGNPAARPFYSCRGMTSASMTSSGSSRISASKARNRL